MHGHILGAYVHMCARYEVSVIKPVAGRTVARKTKMTTTMTMTTSMQDATQLTIHDYIGSSAISK